MADDSDGSRSGRQDEKVAIPLPFEDAMRALLKVDPATVPAEQNGKPEKRPAKPRKK
jgi:hypothetical protein